MAPGRYWHAQMLQTVVTPETSVFSCGQMEVFLNQTPTDTGALINSHRILFTVRPCFLAEMGSHPLAAWSSPGTSRRCTSSNTLQHQYAGCGFVDVIDYRDASSQQQAYFTYVAPGLNRMTRYPQPFRSGRYRDREGTNRGSLSLLGLR
jgi:hypothetical protein